MPAEGWSAPRTGQAYARAREACSQLGETPQLFPALKGLAEFYLARAEYKAARELAEQLGYLAQSLQDPAIILEAHLSLGNTLLLLGEFVLARAHLEQGIALYNRQQHRSHVLLYGHDPGVWCLFFLAMTLWHLGYPEQALERSQEALILARERGEPHVLVNALGYAALLHQCRREVPATRERAEAEMELASEHGFVFFLAEATLLRGWALVEQGREAEGIAQLSQGLVAWRTAGAEIGRPYYLGWLAGAYGRAGQADAGLNLLAEALALVDHNGEGRWEAELYRLKGELTLRKCQISDSKFQVVAIRSAHRAHEETEAEACFRQAIEIARRQQEKSLELRATISLAQLLEKQGRRDEACTMLAEIYGWFTEGFDTADLKDAKTLLDELGT